MAEAERIEPTNFDDSLTSALGHARSTDEEGMADFLRETAYYPSEEGAEPIYRRFEAAASWLEAEPDTLLKAKDGVTFSDPARAIASLRARQREMDIGLGLVPTATPSTNWRLALAGTSR